MGEALSQLADLMEHATSRPARQYIANIKELQRVVRQSKVRAKPAEYIQTLLGEGREAIQRTLRADQAAEVERLQGELDKERARYEAGIEKNLERVDIKARMAERRFKAMSDDELRGLVPTHPADPLEFDALAGELMARGLVAEHIALRTLGVQESVHEPWRKSEVGAAIVREMELASPVEGTGVRLDYDGRTAAVDYEWAYEMIEAAGREAEHE